jgi:uncharacterized protein YdeI (YjbR/CyaY-like superfamily)
MNQAKIAKFLRKSFVDEQCFDLPFLFSDYKLPVAFPGEVRKIQSLQVKPRKELRPSCMNTNVYLSFETAEALESWLEANHYCRSELWVRIYKKDTGITSVTWSDCVIATIAWGWIDGLKKPLDAESFLQRLTPRRAKSNWSKKNREHAERLITEGRMQPGGLVHVEAARSDGRWEQAYSGSAEMVIPEDFLKLLNKNQAAKKFFATLNRTNLYTIYHRLQTAKRPETRSKRIKAMIEQLASGKAFHV